MSFDAASFLDSTVSGANDTKITPCPIGEYIAIIDKVNARQWQSKDNTQTGIAIDVDWEIDSEEARQTLGRSKVTARQGIMLDIDPATGGLDMGPGKNVGLGRLREALGLNEPGQQFAFSMLNGRAGRVSVTHRDGQTPEDKYAEIKVVTKV